LIIVYIDFSEESGTNYLSNYNLTDDRWEYENIEIEGDRFVSASNSMEIYQDKIYITYDNQIYCYKVMTGELIWKQNLTGFIGYSGFTIGDSILVANCEETFTYGTSPETGQILWKVKSGGTTSPIAIMNGVAYFSGGSDGRLNAIDVTTGQYLWKLKPPGEEYWKRHVAVVPGDGKRPDLIVASTYKEYMAFPAAR
jgi:outer membrane protein assembly factor BamB